MPEPICSPNHDTWEKRFIPAKPKATLRNRLFRVCAYCRVSTGNDAQLSSFELQQAHYRQLADQRPNWSLRHIYADEGISGVSLKNRTAFNDMIAACEKGEYDLIVTKSVSRFARNLVDCISLVRRLKNLDPPVGVFFETDNLNKFRIYAHLSCLLRPGGIRQKAGSHDLVPVPTVQGLPAAGPSSAWL